MYMYIYIYAFKQLLARDDTATDDEHVIDTHTYTHIYTHICFYRPFWHVMARLQMEETS